MSTNLPKPISLNNGNSSLVGFVVRNRTTGEVIDDGYGHVKLYADGKAAKRKASQLNNAPVERFDHWVVFPCNLVIGQSAAR